MGIFYYILIKMKNMILLLCILYIALYNSNLKGKSNRMDRMESLSEFTFLSNSVSLNKEDQIANEYPKPGYDVVPD